MLDLGQLRSFVEVAERGTIAAAAKAQDFTAPAISQHIAKLERELGTQLFDRAGRRLRLTDAGVALLPNALEMLDLEAVCRAAAAGPTATPHVVVGGFASALGALVVPKLGQLGAMTVEIIEVEDAEAIRDLSLGELDLVLTQEYQGRPEDRDPRFAYTPVATDRLRLVLPSDLSPRTTIADLGETDWLINGRATRCAVATQQILGTAGLAPAIAGVVADNHTLLAMVAAGHGVTVVPELLLGEHNAGITIAAEDLGVARTILAVNRTIASESIAPLIDLLRTDAPSVDRS